MPMKYGTKWDDDDMRRAIEQAPVTYRRTMKAALQMMLQETRKELVANSPGGKGGEGNLASSWQILVGFGGELSGSVRAGVPYAFWVDQGRKPGRMPPYDPIEQWVHRLGLGERVSGQEREDRRPRAVKATGPRPVRSARSSRTSRGESTSNDREQIIYLIRRKIGERGTYTPNQPPHFLDKSRRNVEPRLEIIYERGIDAFVAAVSSQ